MIWESIALMTFLDVVIFATAVASVWIVLTHRDMLVKYNVVHPSLLMVFGLLTIGLFSLADLIIMVGLPLLIPRATAMVMMETLHHNYSWTVMFVAVGCIFAALALTHRRLFSLVDHVTLSEASLGRELTERKQVEEILREASEEVREARHYLTRLIESSADAIISTDKEGNVVLFNKGAEALLGYQREELVGQRVSVIYESGERAKEVMRRMRQQGGAMSGLETVLRAKDGSPIPVLISASILVDEEGQEVGTVGFNKDLRERKQAEAELQARAGELTVKTERLEGLATLSRTVSATLDPQRVLDFVVEATVRLLSVNLSRLALWDEAAGVLRFAASSGDPDLVDYPRKVSIPGQGMSGLAFQRRETLVTDEAATDPRFGERTWAQEKGVHAYAAVPLLVGERSVGVLTAARRNTGSFQTEEITLLTSFANQAAIAIKHAHLFEEMESTNRRLFALNRVAEAVNRSLNLGETLEGALEATLKAVELHAGIIRLWDEQQGVLVIAAHRGISEEYLNRIGHFRSGEGFLGKVFESGEALLVEDIGDYPHLNEMAEKEGVRSLAAIPIRSREKIVGAMSILSHGQRRFTPAELELLTAIGNQIGIAIENARHMDEAEKRARRLQTLTGVTRLMTSSLDHRQVANSIVEAAAELLGVDLVRLWGEDETTQAFHVLVSHGAEDLAATPHLRIGKGEGVIGAVWETGEPAFIPDLREEPRWLNVPLLDRTGLRGFAGLPLVIEDRVIWALSLFTREVRHFTPEERELMVLFADQAAISLDKARLYREVTEQRQHLEETIAERKRAEAALQVAKDYAEDLIGSSLDMIISADLHRRIVEFNRAAEETFGYSKAEVLGKRVHLLYADPSEGARVHTSLMKYGRFAGEVTNKRKNGETFCCYLSASVIRDASGRVAGGMGISRDITEQKKAEEARRRLEKAVETMQLGVTITDTDGRIVYTNPADASTHGYRVNDLIGNDGRIFAPSKLWKPMAKGQMKEFNSWRRQTVNIRKDGSIFPVQLMSDVVTDAAGEPIGVVTICEDITEQKCAEEQLRKLSRTVEQSPSIVIITDTSGNIEYVNPKFTQITGYTPEEVIGQNPRILKSDETPPEEYKRLWDTITSGREWRGELYNKKKNGGFYWASASILPIKDSEGGITHFLGVQEDITERKEAEAAVRESQERFHSVVESANDAIILADVDGNIISWNKGAQTIFGYGAEEVCGKPITLLVPERYRDTHRAGVERVRAGGTSHVIGKTVQLIGLRKGGGEFPLELALSSWTTEKGTFYSGIVRDITERKRAEEALRESNRRLEEALAELQATQQQVLQQERLRALGQMASGIAHDFNNALSPIVGFSELLLDRPEHLADEVKAVRFLRMINTAGKDAANVVRRLREFYRAREEDEIFLSVGLKELVEQAISLTQPRWKDQALASGTTIDIETDLQNVPLVTGNEAEIREVMTNLILNAVDAMPEGGTITVRTRPDGDHVVLEVSDTGTGMTGEVRERCLEPFFSTKGKRGTGLGLAMVYGIIQRHQGKLAVESEPGRGTSFIIQLPIHTEQKAEETSQEAAAPSRPLRVLVVDDEPPVREVVAQYLSADGHSVETASNGSEGLEKFRAGCFDLVVTDKGMPEMAGDQMATVIKRIASDTPVILLTGFGDLMIASGPTPAGVDIIVSKPVTLAALRQALAKAMAEKVPS